MNRLAARLQAVRARLDKAAASPINGGRPLAISFPDDGRPTVALWPDGSVWPWQPGDPEPFHPRDNVRGVSFEDI